VRIAIGGFGLTIFAVAIVLTPFAMFLDWPAPFVFVLVDAVSLFAWAQAIQARSGLSWPRTSEWIAAFIALLGVWLVWFAIVRLGSMILGQGLVAIVGYLLFVVGVAWAFGWIMMEAPRARAFLALRRVLMSRGTPEDVAILERGPRAYW